MKTPLSPTHRERVEREITDTHLKLSRELSFSKDLQYQNRIDELNKHLLHLNDMLVNGWKAPVFSTN